MESESDRGPEAAIGAGSTAAGSVPAEVRDGLRAPQAGPPAHSDPRVAGSAAHRGRRWLLIHGIILSLVVAGYFLYPVVNTMLNTVSTDDAYVNSHVTFVAPRVAGQVSRVLVDDNYRVTKGDLLVQLDREPYQVQVEIKKAAVVNAEADLQGRRGPGPGHPGQGSAARGGSSRRRSSRSTTRSPSCGPASRP